MTVGLIARDDESSEFFNATAQNTLLVQRCEHCKHLQYPLPFAASVGRCRNCGRPDLSWQPVSGFGVLITWTHLHRKPSKAGTPTPVTTVAIVELDEGPWVHTQLRHIPETLHAGDRVVVAFERTAAGEAIPVFENGSMIRPRH